MQFILRIMLKFSTKALNIFVLCLSLFLYLFLSKFEDFIIGKYFQSRDSYSLKKF